MSGKATKGKKNGAKVLEAAEREGKLETEIERDGEDDQGDVEELERGARKKLEHERELKTERNRRYKEKLKDQRKRAREDADAQVDETLKNDPELAEVFANFTGKIGTAEDLAAAYGLLFAPVGIFVHEEFQLFDFTTGKPSAECMQLARGTWPLMKKYAGPWLAWVRTHSPEVLAIATVTFFISRKLPTVMTLVQDPSQLRINRLRAAAAGARPAPQHPPRQEETAAASQVLDMQRERPAPAPEPGKAQEAA